MRPAFKKASVGERGKDAESKVKKELAALESASCSFYRFPDRRAGATVTAPCDYYLLKDGHSYFIEVKEVEHEFRLPHSNFEKPQIARMRKFKWAGATSIVLVYFKPLDMWRARDVDYFLNTEGGSWDMRDTKLKTLSDALKEFVK